MLDFGGVVIKTPFELVEGLERRIGAAPGTFAWYGPFAPDRDDAWRAMQADEITERDYWARRAEEVGRARGDDAPMSTKTAMRIVFGGPDHEFVRPEALAAIARTRAAGIAVAVLTNDLAAFHGPDWYSALGVSKLVDHLVDASVTGILKPDPRAYAQVLEGIRVRADEALFVDDQQRNVDGARRAGLRALTFDVTRPAASYDAALDMLGVRAEREASSAFEIPRA